MTSKKTTEAPKPGHNSGLDPAEERAFIREFANLKDAESEMAEAKGTMSGIYKRLENAGFTKADIAWAKQLEKQNVSEVVTTMRRRLSIATIMGHAIGRQFDMFEKDRTPIEDQAYEEGLAAGKLRKTNVNPYGMDSLAGQNWQKGFNEGTAFVNEALAEVLTDNIIKAGDDGDDDGEDDAPLDFGGDDDGDPDGDEEPVTAEAAE